MGLRGLLQGRGLELVQELEESPAALHSSELLGSGLQSLALNAGSTRSGHVDRTGNRKDPN